MFSVLPFRPIKGQAFKVYFDAINITNTAVFLSSAPGSVVRKISKDNGAYANTTNAHTNVGTPSYESSVHYIQLTATEMDADVITISINNLGASVGDRFEAITIVIYTDGFTGFGKSKIDQDDLVSGSTILPLSSPTIGDMLQALYWYLRKNKNRR